MMNCFESFIALSSPGFPGVSYSFLISVIYGGLIQGNASAEMNSSIFLLMLIKLVIYKAVQCSEFSRCPILDAN